MNRETREGEREEEGMDPERWKYTHTHTVDREEGMEKGSGRSEEGGGKEAGLKRARQHGGERERHGREDSREGWRKDNERKI